MEWFAVGGELMVCFSSFAIGKSGFGIADINY